MTKWIIGGVIVLAVAGAGLYAYRAYNASHPTSTVTP